jgi:hypothetical protein
MVTILLALRKLGEAKEKRITKAMRPAKARTVCIALEFSLLDKRFAAISFP